MRTTREPGPWVVYRLSVKGRPSTMNVVCEQADWAALDAADPGVHTLVKSGIATENEAERHAREAMPVLLSCPKKYR